MSGQLEKSPKRNSISVNNWIKKRFTTSDIIVISMYGALGIVSGILGTILHGASMAVPILGSFILHTLIPGIIVFACISTVRKPGTATLYFIISAIAYPLMGSPLFILSNLSEGIAIDLFSVILKRKAWTKFGISILGIIYGIIGLYMLYFVVLRLQGLEFPVWIFLVSLPMNIIFGVISAFIGLKLGKRASSVILG